MTNLSNSSPRKPNRLIIIHGLNNSEHAFDPLKKQFQQFGFEAHFLTLPCHGSKREEAKDFTEAFECFDKNMNVLTDKPFSVIAFSQGALYLQLWLNNNPDKLPHTQVLLAPALFILKQKLAELLFFSLPAFLPTKSFSPKEIRRFSYLTIRDYQILMGGLKAYGKLNPNFRIPTLLLIDPKDELVDAKALHHKFNHKSNLTFKLFPREYLNKGLGCHHILFHPEYHSAEDWQKMTEEINQFLIRP